MNKSFERCSFDFLDEADENLEFMCREWYADDRQEDQDDTDEYPEKFYRIYMFQSKHALFSSLVN